VYKEAHPIFLANYLFELTPIGLSYISDDGKRVRGEIVKIIRHHDDEVGSPIEDKLWMQAAESEVGKLCSDEWLRWYAENDEGFDPTLRSARDYWNDHWEDDWDEFWGEGSENDFRFPDAWFFWLGEWNEDFCEYQTRSDRAVNVIKNFLATKRMMRALHIWGPENAARIRHLRIIWGEDELISDFSAQVGPTALSIMSLVAKLWLTGLTHVCLRQVSAATEHKDAFQGCCCSFESSSPGHRFISGHDQQYWTEIEKWDSFGADGIRRNEDGTEYSRMILGLDRLEKNCPKVTFQMNHFGCWLNHSSLSNSTSKIGTNVEAIWYFQINGLWISIRGRAWRLLSRQELPQSHPSCSINCIVFVYLLGIYAG
jgi:hypothetical protein